MVAKSETKGKGKRGRPVGSKNKVKPEAAKKARPSPPQTKGSGRKQATRGRGGGGGSASHSDEGDAGAGNDASSDDSSSSSGNKVHKSPIEEPIVALNHFLKDRHTSPICAQGLIVWAKVEGFSWWPALVVPEAMQATDDSRKSESHILVNFFATDAKNSFGYVLPHKCVPFHDYYERFSRISSQKKKKTAQNLAKAVEAALEMQTSLGMHVTEELKHLNPVYEVDGTLPRNACYCVYCFDGGDLALCDHCPASLHLGCVGLPEDAITQDMNFYCPPCTGYHISLGLERTIELNKGTKTKAITNTLKNVSKLLSQANYRSYHAFLADVHAIFRKHIMGEPQHKEELENVEAQVNWCIDQVFRASEDAESEADVPVNGDATKAEPAV